MNRSRWIRKISDSDWLPLSSPWITITTTDREPGNFITQVTGCSNRWAEVAKIGPVLSALAEIGHFKAQQDVRELVRANRRRRHVANGVKNSETVVLCGGKEEKLVLQRTTKKNKK